MTRTLFNVEVPEGKSLQHLWDTGRWETLDALPRQAVKTTGKLTCFLLADSAESSGPSFPWFVKSFKTRSYWPSTIFFGIAHRKALRIWKNHLHLFDQKVPVPAPLAFISDKAVKRSWLVSSNLSQARDLRDCAKAYHPSDERWTKIFFASATALRSLHQTGVIHGDFKWGNLLWRAESQEIFITDFDGVKPLNRNPNNSPERDLARFIVNGLEFGFSPQILKNQFLDVYCSNFSPAAAIQLAAVSSYVRLFQTRHQRKYDRSTTAWPY